MFMWIKKIHSVNNNISIITQNAKGQGIEIKAGATVNMDAAQQRDQSIKVTVRIMGT